jgi:hypothetical protein
MISISGQEIIPSEKSPWSISLSFSPKLGFNLNGYASSDIDESYLFSLDLRAEHKFSDNFSYSFGVNFNRNDMDFNEIIFDGFGAGQRYKSVRYLVEFPLQINYHLISNAKRIDPYLKMSLRNSYFHHSTVGTLGNEPISEKTSDYHLFYDLGFGSHFQINKKISIILESCIGYGVVYYKRKFGYFEDLLGMRYSFQ